MKADILLAAPINDVHGEWRRLTGDPHIHGALEYGSICEFMNQLPVKGQVTALVMINGRPVVIVGDYLSHVFGDQSPYAWEEKRAGGRGRPNQYNIGYHFPEDSRALPAVSQIKKQAEQDVRRLIEAAYRAVDESGSSMLGPETAEFSLDVGVHSGAWEQAAEALASGRPVVPFLDTGTETIPWVQTVSKSSPAHTVEASSSEKKTLLPKRVISFLRVTSVMIGSTLMLRGGMSLLKTLRGLSSGVAHGIDDASDSNKASITWDVVELAGGAGLTLWGLLSGGRQR